jgi:hypothetical protein
MLVPLPVVGVSSALLPFAAVALAMIAITIFVLVKVLPRQREPPLLTQLLLAVSVLSGGSVLLLALLFVFLNPNGTTAWTWVLLAFNFMMMFPVGLWFVSLVLFEDRRISPGGWLWPVTLGGVTTGSEVLMGLLFAVGGTNGPLSVSSAVALGLSSVWLYWSMAAVMAALVAWTPLSAIERSGSVALALASVFAPWVTAFPLVGGLAAAAVMVGLFLFVARLLLRHRASPAELRFLLALNGLFLAMAASAIALVSDGGGNGSRILFGVVMVSGMVGEVGYLVRRCYRRPDAATPALGEADPARPRRATSRALPLEPSSPELPAPTR